jgi:DNA-directed RNA polymerase specialized sigma24 family protein
VIITEGLDAYLALVRGPTKRLLEDNPEIHAAFLQAISGSKEAMAKLYTHYLPTLTRLARARAKNAEDAEDAVHDVLTRIMQGKFAAYKPETPQGVTAILMRSVINAVKNKNRARKGLPPVAIGPEAEAGEHDPAAPEKGERVGTAKGKTTRLSEPEKETVRAAIGRALQAAKLTDKEQEFIKRIVGSGEGLTGAAPGKEASVAAEIWPEKAGLKDPSDPTKGYKSTIRVHAKRVKERFLKSLCGDKELNALLPTGHAREKETSALHATIKGFKSLCAEEVILFAEALDLPCYISEGHLDADKVYDEVIGWVRASVAR